MYCYGKAMIMNEKSRIIHGGRPWQRTKMTTIQKWNFNYVAKKTMADTK